MTSCRTLAHPKGARGPCNTARDRRAQKWRNQNENTKTFSYRSSCARSLYKRGVSQFSNQTVQDHTN